MKLDSSARKGFSPILSALGTLCIDRHLANLSLRSFRHALSFSTQAARYFIGTDGSARNSQMSSINPSTRPTELRPWANRTF